MKIAPSLKLLSLSIMLVGGLAGCANQTSKTAEPAAAAPSGASTQALSEARAAIDTAKSLDWIWRDTEKLMTSAEEAAKAGDEAKAVKLANSAKAQAEIAVNQYYLEKAKAMLGNLNKQRKLSAGQKSAAEQASAALANAEGKKAFDILSAI